MFSMFRKSSVEQLVRSLIAANSVAPSVTFSGLRLINTFGYLTIPKHSTKPEYVNGRGKDFVRTLSTSESPVFLPENATDFKDVKEVFMTVFPDFLREVSQKPNNYNAKEVCAWFSDSLQYNIPHGKKYRGPLTTFIYQKLVEKEQLTQENIKKAHYLGWCVEMVHNVFIINDDIMDASSTRHGKTCWHKLDNVGMTAVNDMLMIENAIFTILKKHFRHNESYLDLLNLFHEASFTTACGQALDFFATKKNVTSFTMDMYKSITDNKTSYLAVYLPLALGMNLAGYKDSEELRRAKKILFEIGLFYQVQNDFLDCFVSSEITGKIGNDIQENKCSWLAITCMERANEAQKKIMTQCYGQNDPIKIARVVELYKELELPKAYAVHEGESYNKIKTKIQQISLGVLSEIYLQILNMIYKRDS